MSLRVYTTGVIVLHRINLAEHDKILTLYTEERGKLNAVAKGARKPVSKLAGATELFTHSRMQLAVGSHLDIVTQAEIRDAFQHTRSDLARIAYASVMAEILDRSVEERDPHPEVFRLLLECLRSVDRSAHPDLVALLFELQLLAHLGYEPHLGGCVAGGAGEKETPVAAFSPSLGGTLCAGHARSRGDAMPMGAETLALGQALLRVAAPDGESLDALGSRASAAARRELEKTVRSHLQYRIERPVRSMDFVREVQAMIREA